MKRFICAVCMMAAVALQADVPILVLQVTNAAGTTNGDYITINGATRRATNDVSSSPGTLFAATNVAGAAATNLYRQLALYDLPNISYVAMTNSTSLELRGANGSTLSYTIGGTWGVGTLSTGVTAQAGGVLMFPPERYSLTTRSNYADAMVEFLRYCRTNKVAQDNAAWAEFCNLHGSQTLSNKTLASPVLLSPTITSPVISNATLHASSGTASNMALSNSRFAGTNSGTIYGGTNSGTRLESATAIWLAGSGSNRTEHTLVMTNAVNYGNAFSSPGSGTGSEQFGSGASATNENALAVGKSASAGGVAAFAIGNVSSASGDYASAVGVSAVASGFGSIALGNAARATAIQGIAIGPGAIASNQNSIAMGAASRTTADNMVVIGSGVTAISLNGIVSAGEFTNSFFSGNNYVTGTWAWNGGAVSSLAAGLNRLFPLNYQIIECSAPAAYTLACITNGFDGRWLLLDNVSSYPLTLAHESGWTGWGGERITTFAYGGGDVTLPSRGCAWLRYSGSGSTGRWVLSFASATNLVVQPAVYDLYPTAAPGTNLFAARLWNSNNVAIFARDTNGVDKLVVSW